MIWLILIAIFIVSILLYSEYKAHDCTSDNTCNHSVSKPDINTDTPLEYIDKLRRMAENNYDYVAWRQSLIVGIIVGLPIIYFLKERSPTLLEWGVITSLVFIAVYSSSNWIWSHFFYPNGSQTEKSLLELRDKIQTLMYSNLDTNLDIDKEDDIFLNHSIYYPQVLMNNLE